MQNLNLLDFRTVRKPGGLSQVSLVYSNILGTSTGEDLTFTDGSWANFPKSTFSLPYTAELAAVDAVFNYFYSGVTPIARSWQEWMDLAGINFPAISYNHLGELGIAIYSNASLSTSAIAKIAGVLKVYDSTPAPFTFTPVTVEVDSTDVESNEVTLAEIGPTATVTITSGEHNINDTGWSSDAGYAVVGDLIKVRGDASSEYETDTTVSLTVGTRTVDFVITTEAEVVIPGDGFPYTFPFELG